MEREDIVKEIREAQANIKEQETKLANISRILGDETEKLEAMKKLENNLVNILKSVDTIKK